MTVRIPPAELTRLNVDRWTEPFWRAAAEHRLVCQRCLACRAFRMPPSPVCHACRSQDCTYDELSGEGIVYSFTIVRKAVIPALNACLPYVVALVDLWDAEGIRVVTNLVDLEPEDVRIGMKVTVSWGDVAPGVALPRFRPA
jgi:hypothetical protein